MDVERVLERIGSKKKEEVVIDKNFFYCGRMKENDLICLSLQVSREHCLFTKLLDGLYVTDLGSANGVYINGDAIRPKKQILLKENDYIGIGCADMRNLNESMFVYKIKSRNVGGENIQNITSADVKECNVEDSSRFALKEQSRSRKSDSIEILTKVPKKTLEHKLIIANYNDNLNKNANEDDDIQIIEPTNIKHSIKLEKEDPNVQKEVVEYVNTINLEKKDDISKETAECFNTFDHINKIVEKLNFNDVPQVLLSKEVKEVQKSHAYKNNDEKMDLDLVPQVHNPTHEIIEKHVDDNGTIKKLFLENVNIKQESENYINHDNAPAIKQELACFSQIDVVEINDDEDSIFPFSQLFDKIVVKEEVEGQDNLMQQSSLFLDDDDENIITILDSDDENACEINKLTELVSSVKNESEFEFPNTIVPTSFASNNVVNISSNNVDALSNNELNSNVRLDCAVAKIKMTNELLNEQEKSIPRKEVLSEKFISNDVFVSNKIKNKGLKIIEPHFMKPKVKAVKKEKKKSNNKESEINKYDKIKKHSSDSLSSFAEKSINEELSSKNSKHKKHINHSSINNSKNISLGNQSSNKDKKHMILTCKSTLSTKSKNYKHSESQAKMIPKHKTTTVKVKISKKTRGDMLCDSMQILKSNVKSKGSSSTETKTSKPSVKSSQLASFVIPRRKISPSSTSTGNSVLGVNELSNQQSTSYNKQPVPILSNTTNHINVSSNVSNVGNNKAPSKEQITEEDKSVYSKLQPLKSVLTIPSSRTTTQKRVSFKENISLVREFGIEEGNQLRNIRGGLSIRSTKKDFMIYKTLELKIEDFLVNIFAWEPIWLEQQQIVKTLPPIVKQEDMHELPNHFKTFEEYYKKMEVLLLLETWQQLLKEYESGGNRYNSSIVLPCKLVKHSIRQMQTPNGFKYSMLLINTIVSKNQLRLQNHPVYGDMIILEYVIKEDVQKIRRIFAYVVQVQQQNSSKFLKLNEQLCKYVTNPDAFLSYTVQTRIIDESAVQFDQIARLRSIMYMRSHLRLIQGLQFIPHSLLRDSILKVDIDEFQLEPVTKQQIHDYQLVTEQKLNEKQMEAVIKFTNASIKLEPKICLLIGPPGTGKSKVIANLVTQILYGDGRYVQGQALRILVCAPSNAAVDEIVLRLLDIRGAIKEHRFKMVRIGRMESMHEEVKKISITNLAKREAQKMYLDRQHKRSEIFENKKHKLKVNINELKLLLAKNPNNQAYKKYLEDYHAKYKKLTNPSSEAEAAELSKLQNSAKILILEKANIIACTLSSCYTSQMEYIFGGYSKKITICIVDEATQCCEPETLIPLMLGVKNLILVGDPNQLPATVMSTEAKKFGLDKSLFTRAKITLESQYQDATENRNDPIIMLNVQYRMISAISHWPNQYFYGGKLMNAVNDKQSFPFQPYRVLNLDAVQDNIKFSNTNEAVFVGNLINCLMTYGKLSSWDEKITIGVITPYQSQKSLILSTIKEHTRNISDNIKNKFMTEVNTIDSFQGQERDVIIMSCVRSSGIGFLSDQQRLCVALTRAKSTLIICGNFTTFQRDKTWKNLLQDACARDVVVYLNTNAKPYDIKNHVIKLD